MAPSTTTTSSRRPLDPRSGNSNSNSGASTSTSTSTSFIPRLFGTFKSATSSFSSNPSSSSTNNSSNNLSKTRSNSNSNPNFNPSSKTTNSNSSNSTNPSLAAALGKPATSSSRGNSTSGSGIFRDYLVPGSDGFGQGGIGPGGMGLEDSPGPSSRRGSRIGGSGGMGFDADEDGKMETLASAKKVSSSTTKKSMAKARSLARLSGFGNNNNNGGGGSSTSSISNSNNPSAMMAGVGFSKEKEKGKGKNTAGFGSYSSATSTSLLSTNNNNRWSGHRPYLKPQKDTSRSRSRSKNEDEENRRPNNSTNRLSDSNASNGTASDGDRSSSDSHLSSIYPFSAITPQNCPAPSPTTADCYPPPDIRDNDLSARLSPPGSGNGGAGGKGKKLMERARSISRRSRSNSVEQSGLQQQQGGGGGQPSSPSANSLTWSGSSSKPGFFSNGGNGNANGGGSVYSGFSSSGGLNSGRRSRTSLMADLYGWREAVERPMESPGPGVSVGGAVDPTRAIYVAAQQQHQGQQRPISVGGGYTSGSEYSGTGTGIRTSWQDPPMTANSNITRSSYQSQNSSSHSDGNGFLAVPGATPGSGSSGSGGGMVVPAGGIPGGRLQMQQRQSHQYQPANHHQHHQQPQQQQRGDQKIDSRYPELDPRFSSITGTGESFVTAHSASPSGKINIQQDGGNQNDNVSARQNNRPHTWVGGPPPLPTDQQQSGEGSQRDGHSAASGAQAHQGPLSPSGRSRSNTTGLSSAIPQITQVQFSTDSDVTKPHVSSRGDGDSSGRPNSYLGVVGFTAGGGIYHRPNSTGDRLGMARISGSGGVGYNVDGSTTGMNSKRNSSASGGNGKRGSVGGSSNSERGSWGSLFGMGLGLGTGSGPAGKRGSLGSNFLGFGGCGGGGGACGSGGIGMTPGGGIGNGLGVGTSGPRSAATTASRTESSSRPSSWALTSITTTATTPGTGGSFWKDKQAMLGSSSNVVPPLRDRTDSEPAGTTLFQRQLQHSNGAFVHPTPSKSRSISDLRSSQKAAASEGEPTMAGNRTHHHHSNRDSAVFDAPKLPPIPTSKCISPRTLHTLARIASCPEGTFDFFKKEEFKFDEKDGKYSFGIEKEADEYSDYGFRLEDYEDEEDEDAEELASPLKGKEKNRRSEEEKREMDRKMMRGLGVGSRQEPEATSRSPSDCTSVSVSSSIPSSIPSNLPAPRAVKKLGAVPSIRARKTPPSTPKKQSLVNDQGVLLPATPVTAIKRGSKKGSKGGVLGSAGRLVGDPTLKPRPSSQLESIDDRTASAAPDPENAKGVNSMGSKNGKATRNSKIPVPSAVPKGKENVQVARVVYPAPETRPVSRIPSYKGVIKKQDGPSPLETRGHIKPSQTKAQDPNQGQASSQTAASSQPRPLALVHSHKRELSETSTNSISPPGEQSARPSRRHQYPKEPPTPPPDAPLPDLPSKAEIQTWSQPDPKAPSSASLSSEKSIILRKGEKRPVPSQIPRRSSTIDSRGSIKSSASNPFFGSGSSAREKIASLKKKSSKLAGTGKASESEDSRKGSRGKGKKRAGIPLAFLEAGHDPQAEPPETDAEVTVTLTPAFAKPTPPPPVPQLPDDKKLPDRSTISESPELKAELKRSKSTARSLFSKTPSKLLRHKSRGSLKGLKKETSKMFSSTSTESQSEKSPQSSTDLSSEAPNPSIPERVNGPNRHSAIPAPPRNAGVLKPKGGIGAIVAAGHVGSAVGGLDSSQSGKGSQEKQASASGSPASTAGLRKKSSMDLLKDAFKESFKDTVLGGSTQNSPRQSSSILSFSSKKSRRRKEPGLQSRSKGSKSVVQGDVMQDLTDWSKGSNSSSNKTNTPVSGSPETQKTLQTPSSGKTDKSRSKSLLSRAASSHKLRDAFKELAGSWDKKDEEEEENAQIERTWKPSHAPAHIEKPIGTQAEPKLARAPSVATKSWLPLKIGRRNSTKKQASAVPSKGDTKVPDFPAGVRPKPIASTLEVSPDHEGYFVSAGEARRSASPPRETRPSTSTVSSIITSLPSYPLHIPLENSPHSPESMKSTESKKWKPSRTWGASNSPELATQQLPRTTAARSRTASIQASATPSPSTPSRGRNARVGASGSAASSPAKNQNGMPAIPDIVVPQSGKKPSPRRLAKPPSEEIFSNPEPAGTIGLSDIQKVTSALQDFLTDFHEDTYVESEAEEGASMRTRSVGGSKASAASARSPHIKIRVNAPAGFGVSPLKPSRRPWGSGHSFPRSVTGDFTCYSHCGKGREGHIDPKCPVHAKSSSEDLEDSDELPNEENLQDRIDAVPDDLQDLIDAVLEESRSQDFDDGDFEFEEKGFEDGEPESGEEEEILQDLFEKDATEEHDASLLDARTQKLGDNLTNIFAEEEARFQQAEQDTSMNSSMTNDYSDTSSFEGDISHAAEVAAKKVLGGMLGPKEDVPDVPPIPAEALEEEEYDDEASMRSSVRDIISMGRPGCGDRMLDNVDAGIKLNPLVDSPSNSSKRRFHTRDISLLSFDSSRGHERQISEVSTWSFHGAHASTSQGALRMQPILREAHSSFEAESSFEITGVLDSPSNKQAQRVGRGRTSLRRYSEDFRHPVNMGSSLKWVAEDEFDEEEEMREQFTDEDTTTHRPDEPTDTYGYDAGAEGDTEQTAPIPPPRSSSRSPRDDSISSDPNTSNELSHDTTRSSEISISSLNSSPCPRPTRGRAQMLTGRPRPPPKAKAILNNQFKFPQEASKADNPLARAIPPSGGNPTRAPPKKDSPFRQKFNPLEEFRSKGSKKPQGSPEPEEKPEPSGLLPSPMTKVRLRAKPLATATSSDTVTQGSLTQMGTNSSSESEPGTRRAKRVRAKGHKRQVSSSSVLTETIHEEEPTSPSTSPPVPSIVHEEYIEGQFVKAEPRPLSVPADPNPACRPSQDFHAPAISPKIFEPIPESDNSQPVLVVINDGEEINEEGPSEEKEAELHRKWTHFERDANSEIHKSRYNWPDSEASFLAYTMFMAPTSTFEILEFLFDSQTRFRSNKPDVLSPRQLAKYPISDTQDTSLMASSSSAEISFRHNMRESKTQRESTPASPGKPKPGPVRRLALSEKPPNVPTTLSSSVASSLAASNGPTHLPKGVSPFTALPPKLGPRFAGRRDFQVRVPIEPSPSPDQLSTSFLGQKATVRRQDAFDAARRKLEGTGKPEEQEDRESTSSGDEKRRREGHARSRSRGHNRSRSRGKPEKKNKIKIDEIDQIGDVSDGSILEAGGSGEGMMFSPRLSQSRPRPKIRRKPPLRSSQLMNMR